MARNAKNLRERQRRFARELYEAASRCPRCGRAGSPHNYSLQRPSAWACDYFATRPDRGRD